MLDQQKAILTAALDVFSRHGVKMATMNDIAAEARIERETLYSVFADKDAIFVGIIENYFEEALADIEGLKNADCSLDQCIEIIFDSIARKPYEALHNTPYGAEIIEGISRNAEGRFLEGHRQFSQAIALLIQDHMPENSSVSAADIAGCLVYAAIGLKHTAENRDHMDDLLRSLKRTTVSALQGHS